MDKVDALSIDSTTSKAHRCGAGEKGGGRTTKTQAVTDAVGRLIDFHLCAGQAGDIRFEIPQRSRLPVPDHQLADTTYDDDAFRAFLIGREAVPVIRPNPTRKRVPAFDEARSTSKGMSLNVASHT